MERIYAIIPVTKAPYYISVDYSFGRYSIDRNLIVWDQDWTDEELKKMKADPDIRLFSLGEILEEMAKPEWSAPDELPA